MMYRSHRREILGGNQQIINIPTLKRIVGRYGWFNRHRDIRESKVNNQRIKPPIYKTISTTFKRENANALRGSLSFRFQDGGLATYPQQNSTRIHDNARTKLKQIIHTDKKQQLTVHIYS